MNKRILIFCLLLPAFGLTQAQVSMTLQVPPAGVLVKNQLWNMLLVNTSNTPYLVKIGLVLLDQQTNQPVLTATSAAIMLGKGARQLQAKDLSPIEYAYGAAAYGADQDPNGVLPAGSYQACYTVLNANKGAPMVENCIALNVDPLSPPLLNTPADESKLSTMYPQFTWLPPTPLKIFNDLSYSLVLVEVLDGQGKADAIEQNIPVYSGGFVKNLYVNYPSSYRALDTGRLYAWRIVALNHGQATAMSDIWTFRIGPPVRPALRQKESDSYIDLKRGLDASIASAGEVLNLGYENDAADTLLAYTITSLGDAGNPVIQQGQLSLRNGRNLWKLSLQKSAGFGERKTYLFRIVNGRRETWTVKFTWSPATAGGSLN
jgi:hypothetical protein